MDSGLGFRLRLLALASILVVGLVGCISAPLGSGERQVLLVSALADPCLPLRADPDEASIPVDCLAPGAEVEILATESGSTRVKTRDGAEGWVAPLFLEPAPAEEVEGDEREVSEPADLPDEVATEPEPDPESEPELPDSQPASSVIPIEPQSGTLQAAESRPAPMEPLAPAGPLIPQEPIPVPDPASEIEAAICSWAEAWAAQDAEAYLSAYAQTFSPPQAMSRSDWEGVRRERLERPASIEVALSDLEIVVSGPDRATATFTQSYDSDTFSDVVTKNLKLVLEEGGWKIELEKAAE